MREYKSPVIKALYQAVEYLDNDLVYDCFCELIAELDGDLEAAEYHDEDNRPSSVDTDAALKKLEEALNKVVEEDDEIVDEDEEEEVEEAEEVFDTDPIIADPVDGEDDEDHFSGPDTDAEEDGKV